MEKRALTGVLLFGGGFFSGCTTCCVGALLTTASGRHLIEAGFHQVPAAVDHPKALERDGFELKYPANWIVDTTKDGYDDDHLFLLKSPGASSVLISICDCASDVDGRVRSQVSAFRTRANAHETGRFERWGAFQGQGVELTGKVALIARKFRVFGASDHDRSIVIVETRPPAEETRTKAGFALVESSFRIKPDEAKAK
jgi:hypothetical protein